MVIAIERMKYIVKRWQTGRRVGSEAIFSHQLPRYGYTFVDSIRVFHASFISYILFFVKLFYLFKLSFTL